MQQYHPDNGDFVIAALELGPTLPRVPAKRQHFGGSKGNGGANRNRTDDLLNAIQALSQLSYGPTRGLVPAMAGAVAAAAFARRAWTV